MKSTINFIVALFLITHVSFSQEQKNPPDNKKQVKKEKSEKTKAPRKKISYRPTELRVGADILSLGNSAFEKHLERVEFNADLDFHDYLFNLDLGYENDLFDSIDNVSNAVYSSTGQYFKLGIDKSFSVDNASNSDIFMGFRYARAFYKDELNYLEDGGAWGASALNSSNTANARWLEFTFGMKVSMMKNIALGYIWRLKVAPKASGNDSFAPYKIPGYGTTTGNNNIALNFYAIIKLPVPKKRAGEPKREKQGTKKGSTE